MSFNTINPSEVDTEAKCCCRELEKIYTIFYRTAPHVHLRKGSTDVKPRPEAPRKGQFAVEFLSDQVEVSAFV